MAKLAKPNDINVYKDLIPSQLKEEPNDAYHAFNIYCLLGIKRSINAVALTYNKNFLSDENAENIKPPHHTIIAKYSRLYRWVERVATFDFHCYERDKELIADEMLKRSENWYKKVVTTEESILATIEATQRLGQMSGRMLDKVDELMSRYNDIESSPDTDSQKELEKVNAFLLSIQTGLKICNEVVALQQKAWDVRGYMRGIQLIERSELDAKELLGGSED